MEYKQVGIPEPELYAEDKLSRNGFGQTKPGY